MSVERTAEAPAKINLALIVGPLRADGKHEVLTLLQRIELADEVTVRSATTPAVEGFAEDTLVTAALGAMAQRTGVVLAARIGKRIPVAAGLGGGSSDAATALALANELAPAPLERPALHALAASLGADVPFFLEDGPQLGEGDGTALRPCPLPVGLPVVLALPAGVTKESTGAVYRAFDERDGARGFEERRAALLRAVARLDRVSDLAALPRNDLARSPLTGRLEELGAIRADVSGAGPAVYGVFADEPAAHAAAAALADAAAVWVTRTRS